MGKVIIHSHRIIERCSMTEEMKILAGLVDYPVTVFAFIWALRMIRTMHMENVDLLNRCLDEKSLMIANRRE